MGKVPGVRARKKHVVNQEPRRSQSRSSFSGEQSETTSNVTSTELTFQNSEQDGVLNWSTDWHIEGGDMMSPGFPDESSNIHVAQATTMPATTMEETSSFSSMALSGGDEFHTISMDMGDLLMSQQHQGSPGIEELEDLTPSPQVLMSLGLRPRNEVDSQCSLECCQIISDLENYIMAELKAFNIILGIVKKALAKLTHLMGLQQSARNLRCMLLFTTMMYQILELLEQCLSTVTAEKTRQQSRSLTEGPPGLGFGDFSIDAEEQSAIRIQTVVREIHQATEVLGKLKTLASVEAQPGTADSSAQGRSRRECFSDLEIRFRDLVAQCGRKR